MTNPPATQSRPETIRVSDEHADQLAEFYRAVWDPAANAESVAAARVREAAENPVEPGTTPPAFAFMLDGKVLGYIGTLPNRFWTGKEEPAHWLKGFMVLPEHRGGPIGYFVLKEATRHVGLAAGLMVAPAARRLFEALGYKDLGCLSNHLLLLRPARVFRTIDLSDVGAGGLPAWLPRLARWAQRTGVVVPAGHLFGAGLRAWSWANRLRSRGLRADTGQESASPAELDALWERVRAGLPAATVRDAAYLRWRYRRNGAAYRFVEVREHGSLVGLGVVRRPRDDGGDERLRGIRVSTLADLLFPVDRPDIARAVLSAAAAVARRQGADARLGSVSHAAASSALTRFGFIPLPGNVHFLIRDPDLSRDLPNRMADWWLTRGDGHADESF